MTGQSPRAAGRAVITAAELLGIDAANEAEPRGNASESPGNFPQMAEVPSFTLKRETTKKNLENEAGRLHSSHADEFRARAVAALELIRSGDPFAMLRAVEALDAGVRLVDALDADEGEVASG